MTTRRLPLIITSLAVAASLPACKNRCSPETDSLKCDGKKVVVCACTDPVGQDLAGGPLCDSQGFSWIDGDTCSVACDAAINPTTGCLASTQPVTECAQDGAACWNGDLTYCVSGYPIPTTPCAQGTQCTGVSGCGALCLASSAAPDPRCPASPGLVNDFCEDNTAYFCGCGFLIDSEACGASPNECTLSPAYDGVNHVSGQAASCGRLP